MLPVVDKTSFCFYDNSNKSIEGGTITPFKDEKSGERYYWKTFTAFIYF
jgi:hypothetical protein